MITVLMLEVASTETKQKTYDTGNNFTQQKSLTQQYLFEVAILLIVIW